MGTRILLNSWATTERNSSHSLEVSSSRSGKKKNLSVVGDSMAALVKSAGAPGIVQNWWKPSALAFRWLFSASQIRLWIFDTSPPPFISTETSRRGGWDVISRTVTSGSEANMATTVLSEELRTVMWLGPRSATNPSATFATKFRTRLVADDPI